MVDGPPQDAEVHYVVLKDNAEPVTRIEHHLGAVHKVVHHNLKLWLQVVPVQDVKVDLLISGDREPLRIGRVEDLASHALEHLVLLPLCVLSTAEEENRTGALGNQHFVHQEEDLSKITRSELSCWLLIVAINITVDSHALSLPVEGVALLVKLGVEGLQREVEVVLGFTETLNIRFNDIRAP